MNKDKLKKIFVTALLLYAVLAVAFYYLAGEQLNYKNSAGNISMPDADSTTADLKEGVVIEQAFIGTMDKIQSIDLVFTKYYKEVRSKQLLVEIIHDDIVLASRSIDVSDIEEQHTLSIELEKPVTSTRGREMRIRLSVSGEGDGQIAAMMNSSVQREGDVLYVDGHRIAGTLCYGVTGEDRIWISRYYWPFVAVLGVLLAATLFISYRRYVRNQPTYLVRAIQAMYQYKFLISQLVSRDFKSKYKRSVLGVFWSFLNPLLTMIVQFLVFSTFFKADTKNYPVYLLSGVICFNFFKETTDMCLGSISGNANLINKVYIPKYIFPLARTISSTINLGMSLIPLLLVSLLMGVAFKKAVFLIFYFLICLILFALGVGMFLAALMVFFRDIQFLWSVIVQIWQYATPIFYPAEIIPDRFKFIVKINPLYHFIGNLRRCLINGLSPEPSAYIYCALFALISLLVGSFVFKKTQDKFTLYL